MRMRARREEDSKYHEMAAHKTGSNTTARDWYRSMGMGRKKRTRRLSKKRRKMV